MCLIISKSLHPYDIIWNYDPPKSLKSNKDILVFKYLAISKFFGLITPLRRKPITFNNGICELKADSFRVNLSSVSGFVVEDGIHAYIKSFGNTDTLKVYFAVIPKDTPFYIGTEHDIVSLRLIIFKNRFAYWKYCYKNDFPKKLKEILKNAQ